MATSPAQRSGIRGLSKLRRTLRRLEPEVTDGLRKALREGAEAIKVDAQMLAPRDQGDLIAAIDATIARDGLTAVIGPGAKAAQIARSKGGSAFSTRTRGGEIIKMSQANKALLFQFFKGYWHEFGTKGNPAKNIPPLKATPFMSPAYDMNESWIKKNTRREMAKAIKRASAGGENG